MITAEEFVAGLEGMGVRLVAGVPCSYFAGPIALLERHPRIRYIAAVNEGCAVAAAAGAALAGTPAAVLAQNSGFGNLINPLTSLVLPYQIELLVLLSMRGWPDPAADEPQHAWMGRVVPDWLTGLGIPCATLTAQSPDPAGWVRSAQPEPDRPACRFLLVGKGAIGPAPPGYEGGDQAGSDGRQRPTRAELVEALLREIEHEFVVSTTGYLSRELFNRGDRARNFYMQGSMGHAAGIALGAALCQPDAAIVVLDGDGALLMHMGVLAQIGATAPAHLTHIVFDNGAYESTGAQPSVARAVDFAATAHGCGYRNVRTVDQRDDLRPAIRALLTATGPNMLVVSGVTGGEVRARASGSTSLDQIARRFTGSFAPALQGSGR